MKIVCIGGGPAAVYFAIAIKRQLKQAEISIYEKNASDVKTGWGIILPDDLLKLMKSVDVKSYSQVKEIMQSWSCLRVVAKGETSDIPNQYGSSVDRYEFLNILKQRAVELGVTIEHEHQVSDPLSMTNSDLIICADGAASKSRAGLPESTQVDKVRSKNRFIWLGTHIRFKEMRFIFVDTEAGPVWAHIYPFSETHSTFVVECTEQTFMQLSLGTQPFADVIAMLETLFAEEIPELKLQWLNGAKQWRQFDQLYSKNTFNDKVVFIGDAAQTAHFSIGSGTRLAIEDAVELVKQIYHYGVNQKMYAAFKANRQSSVETVQSQALNSMSWFDNIEQHLKLPKDEFLRSLLFRSIQPALN